MANDAYRELIELLGKQFAAVAHSFDALGLRLDAGETRAEERHHEALGHFEGIYRWLERLEQEYVVMRQQLARIEGALTDGRHRRELLELRVAEVKEQVAVLQARIDDIEQRLRGTTT